MIPLDRPIAFVDVESTGLDPVADRIVEFGVTVLYQDGIVSDPRTWRFNPGIPIPAEATAIHGITDADVANEPAFADWAARIHAGLKGKDIGVYNGRRLDLPILDEEFRRCGGKLNLEGVRIIDCFGIFSKKEPRKLENAVRRYCCGREHETKHAAGTDAAATLDVFLGQLKAYDDLAGMSLDDIATFSRIGDHAEADIAGKLYTDEEGYVRFTFGKHKDRRVLDQPDFAAWMLTKDFPASTCDVIRAELGKLNL